jgi:outer membrane lipoprotein SlyB
MSYRPGVPTLVVFGAVVGFGILGALIGGKLGYYIASAPICIGFGGGVWQTGLAGEVPRVR